ncbi:MAG: Hpt domain-containing protein [Bacteroidota bacterium]
MEEPNLNYIKEIADGNETFERELIAIIQSEFPMERDAFVKYIEASQLEHAAEMVHKLKHKFNILGLTSTYESAVSLEEELRANNASSIDFFLTILDSLNSQIQEL